MALKPSVEISANWNILCSGFLKRKASFEKFTNSLRGGKITIDNEVKSFGKGGQKWPDLHPSLLLGLHNFNDDFLLIARKIKPGGGKIKAVRISGKTIFCDQSIRIIRIISPNLVGLKVLRIYWQEKKSQ